MKRYCIVVNRQLKGEHLRMEKTGFVLKNCPDFSYLQTSMNWELGEAVRIRDQLIKAGCVAANLRIEYDYT